MAAKKLKEEPEEIHPHFEPNAVAMKKLEKNDEQLKKLMMVKPQLSWVAGFFDVSKDSVSRYIAKNYGMTFAEFREHYMANIRVNLINYTINKALKKHSDNALNKCLANICHWKNESDAPFDQDEETELMIVT